MNRDSIIVFFIGAAAMLLLIVLACGCTNTGTTTIPANVTLHVDSLTLVVQPGAVPINITINGKLLTTAPTSQPAKGTPCKP